MINMCANYDWEVKERFSPAFIYMYIQINSAVYLLWMNAFWWSATQMNYFVIKVGERWIQ
jgi:hypothetical protein